ncbi:E3 ubiquitin-protein ligase TRIM11-like [Crotalus adamanteus]|uniref:E3 ubiquitin-protein ligase TRIM11-like n=1 Tax=Crotalus adamanteus TaxID=8729 RepID=A0AAW1BUV6_CROAD
MELQHIVKKLQRELTCSICVKSFLNPTTLACGHNFCHACIVSYWGQFPLEIACPQCQEKIPRLNFIPNGQLANITKLVEELSVDIKQITEEGQVCKDHPPALKVFCRDELVVFCSMCDISQEHQAHDVVPVAEAAEEYKGHLLSVMGTLENEKEKISKYHSEEGTEAVALIEQIEQERQLVITEFNLIRQFLEEQENFLLLKVMETLEKGIFWKKTKHAAILFREVSTFDDLIQGLKEKCQQSAVELLQDVGSTLKRCKNAIMNPVTLPPWMKLEVWDLFDFSAFLGTTMKQFKNTLASAYLIQKANVTLDPDTAHPKLILSEDLKSVWLGRSSQNLIMDDKRFDHMIISETEVCGNCLLSGGTAAAVLAKTAQALVGTKTSRSTLLVVISDSMATGNIRMKLQSEITCFVCLEYLIEPVTLDCGHNFCHACIVKSWGQISDETACPRCKVAVPRLNFKPNGQLANVVHLIRQLSDQAKQMARTSKACKGHETATLSFCKDDLVPVCLLCDGSQKHQTHDVISVAQAAEEYKDKFLSSIESLRKEKKVIMEHLSDTEKQSQDLIQLVEAERQKVRDGFNHLHQLVVEQSCLWLTKTEEVKMEIMLKTNEQTAVISKELFVLDDIIRDLVEKRDQPVLEFLEDAQTILDRYQKKKKFENPMVFPPETKHEIWGLQDFSAFLPGAVKQFEEILASGYQLKKQNEDTTLEPDPTQVKRLRLGKTCQDP